MQSGSKVWLSVCSLVNCWSAYKDVWGTELLTSICTSLQKQQFGRVRDLKCIWEIFMYIPCTSGFGAKEDVSQLAETWLHFLRLSTLSLVCKMDRLVIIVHFTVVAETRELFIDAKYRCSRSRRQNLLLPFSFTLSTQG